MDPRESVIVTEAPETGDPFKESRTMTLVAAVDVVLTANELALEFIPVEDEQAAKKHTSKIEPKKRRDKAMFLLH